MDKELTMKKGAFAPALEVGKKGVSNVKKLVRKFEGLRCALGVSAGRSLQAVGGAGVVAGVIESSAHAQTDITSSITTLSTYQTAAITIGIAVLLWTVGRMLVHKFTRG